jgi:hypothetical protein
VYLLELPVRDQFLQLFDYKHNDSKSFLYTQCKQDAKKGTFAYVVAPRFEGFKSIYFFICDLNDKFQANLSTVILLNDKNFSWEEFMIY